MTPRYFYSTARAALELHVSRRHFMRIAIDKGELPIVFVGRWQHKFIWTRPILLRLIAAYRIHPKWIKRKEAQHP